VPWVEDSVSTGAQIGADSPHSTSVTAVPLLPTAPALGPVFTRAQALAAGMARAQVDRLGDQRVMHGVYASARTTLATRVRAALAIAGPDAAVTGVTALQLAGVDLPARLARDTRVWVQVPHDQHWPRRLEVRLIRARSPAPVTRVRRFPAVQLPYAWLHLAAEANLDEMIELSDGLTRRRNPVSSPAAIQAAVAASTGVPGIQLARSACRWSMPGTDSIPETDLRLLLVRAGLPVPAVNPPVRDETGRPMYWLDLAYSRAWLAVEYDGADHVNDRRRMEDDARRRRYLEDQGWRIITVTAADMVGNPVDVVESVRNALVMRTRLYGGP